MDQPDSVYLSRSLSLSRSLLTLVVGSVIEME